MICCGIRSALLGVLFGFASATIAAQGACTAQSGATVTPVIELYTSEGCSSCPPADRWISALKATATGRAPAVIQAFHVGYWDYIGWVDRFANPAHTTRQRQVASWNNQRSIYTPQAVLNGRDWRDWNQAGASLPIGTEPANTSISLKQLGDDQCEALVSTRDSAPASWGAYWTVTEHGHSSRVKAGENAGEFLQHDYVVRQYIAAGDYRRDVSAPQRLVLRSVPTTAGHRRQINLVVFDSRNGRTLQAVSAGC